MGWWVGKRKRFWPYGHFYFPVAVLTQAWFTSGFDYVRLGHVVLLRLLSLVVLFGYPGVILCILACLQYNAGCAYSLFTHCQGHYKHRHGVCRCCIGIIYVPYIDYIGYLFAIRTMGHFQNRSLLQNCKWRGELDYLGDLVYYMYYCYNCTY